MSSYFECLKGLQGYISDADLHYLVSYNSAAVDFLKVGHQFRGAKSQKLIKSEAY